jgi:hypothetical protein
MNLPLLTASFLFLFFALSFYAFPQGQVIFFEDCERGPGATQLDKIKRYPDQPQVVRYDPMYPHAFPPPSGDFAARCNDAQNQFFGLGSIVVGPTIELTQPGVTPIAIEVKLFMAPSPQYNFKNVALLALDDFAATERYYRYGFGHNSFYFQYFDGSGFTEILYDPVLAESCTFPGWHTLTMYFETADKIYFYVDGRPTNFSPMKQKSITRCRLGALIWDQQNRAPLLADDFKIYKPPAGFQTAEQGTGVTVEELPKINPYGPIQPGKPAEWLTDTNKAFQIAQQRPGMKFLVYFHRPGVASCASIEGNTLYNPGAAPIINRFIPVQIDASKNRPLAEKFEVYKVPQLLVLDIQSRIYWRRLGTISVEALEQSLSRYY